MSKQSDQKEKQKYTPKPAHPVCGNCKHFQSEIKIYKAWDNSTHEKEVKLRCGASHVQFAVKKQGTCRAHEFKK